MVLDRLRSRDRLAAIAVIMGLAVAASNAMLVVQNQKLKERIERPDAPVAARLTDLSGWDEFGRASRVTLAGDRPALVFTLSSDCRFCRASMESWRELSAHLDAAKWRVIWVNRDPFERSRTFFSGLGASNGLVGQILSEVSHRTYAQLGLARVPRSIVVNSDGRVLGVVDGVVTSERLAEIRAIMRDAVGSAGE